MLEGLKSRITKMMTPVESSEATESVEKSGVVAPVQPNSADYSTIVADLPLSTEYGRSGQKVWLPGYNGEEWLPALSGSLAIQVYREMGDQDAYAAACLNAYRTFYRYATWYVQPVSDDPKDVEAAEFLESCMHDMRHAWSSFISECSSTPQYGFSLFEIVYKKRDGKQDDYRQTSRYEDGRIGWSNFSPRAQNTILHFDYLPSDPNYLIGYTQLTPPDYPTNLFIPMEKSILIRTESVKDSPWGRSLLRSAYRSWFMKKYLEDIRCTIIERGGAGIPRAKIPVNLLNNTTYDDTGTVVDVDYAALQSLNSIKSMLKGLRMTKEPYVIVPQQFDENGNSLFEIDFLQSNGADVLGHINTTVKELETAMLVTMMCEFLGIGNGSSGSKALAQVKSSNFTKAVTSHLNTIQSSLNNQCVPRLFEMNPEFRVEELPKIMHHSIEEIPPVEIAAVLSLFPKVGWDLTGQDELRDSILTGMGLSKLVKLEEDAEHLVAPKEEAVIPEPTEDKEQVATPSKTGPERGKNAKTPQTTEPTVDTKLLGTDANTSDAMDNKPKAKVKKEACGCEIEKYGTSEGAPTSRGARGRGKNTINPKAKHVPDEKHPYKTFVKIPGYNDMKSNNAYSRDELENQVNGKMPEGQEFEIINELTGEIVARGIGGHAIAWKK